MHGQLMFIGVTKSSNRVGFMLGREMRVSQSHGKIGVTQKLAHGIQIHAFHDQAAREVMPKIVPTKIFNARSHERLLSGMTIHLFDRPTVIREGIHRVLPLCFT